jgi:dipeptidase
VCDTFVALPAATSDGSVILGKNSDREPNEAHEILMLAATEQRSDTVRATYIEIPQVPRTHAVLLAKPYWIWGAEMGVNDRGLAIGNEAVFTKAKGDKRPGLLGMDMLRLALERCESADEAVDTIAALLVAHGQAGQAGHTHKLQYDNSFLISDRREAWVLETVGRDWAAHRVDSTASISNGLTLGVEQRCSAGLRGVDVASRSDSLYTRFSDSSARQCRTSEVLAAGAGGFRVPDAFRLLRDHGGAGAGFTPARGLMGMTVCAHAGPGPIRGSQSTGSMVAHVTADDVTVWVTGSSAPCTSVFKPVWFDGGLPDEPAAGRDFDAGCRWWRHEVLHRATLRNYPDRLATYADRRDSLETQFLEAAASRGDRGVFTRECFDAADVAEDRWLADVMAVPAVRLPRPYAWAWRRWDAAAGMP